MKCTKPANGGVCGKECVIKVSQSEKNPGKRYYSCPDKAHGFAGWVNAAPKPQAPFSGDTNQLAILMEIRNDMKRLLAAQELTTQETHVQDISYEDDVQGYPASN